MELAVYREFFGTWERVGTIAGEAQAARRFAYDRAYLASKSSRPLSLSLPLRSEPYIDRDFRPFFEGMVPEGPVRTELAHRVQVPVSDGLRLLERIGGECVGALMFLPEGNDPSELIPSYTPLEGDWMGALQTGEISAMAESMQQSRLSLAGAQSKTGWMLPRGENPARAGLGDWLVPKGTAPSTHIVKCAKSGNGDLPYNEWVCMQVASACGIRVARCWVSEVLPQVFISERYDRVWGDDIRLIDGVEVPLRLHQEDFCQMVGWPTYFKYEEDPTSCYARVCGNVLRAASSNVIADVRELAKQLVFDYLVGNCDSHLKNHSVLYDSAWWSCRLAPAYDIVCTTIMGYDRNLGIVIGDHRDIDAVEVNDLMLMTEDLGISSKLLARDCAKMLATLPVAFKRLVADHAAYSKVAQEIFEDSHARIGVVSQFCAECGIG